MAEGPRGVLVYCVARRPDSLRCRHQGRVDLAAFDLSVETPYVHIPRARMLRCSRCGSRDVDVRPDWPSPQEAHARCMSDGSPSPRMVNGILLPRYADTAKPDGGPVKRAAWPRRKGAAQPRGERPKSREETPKKGMHRERCAPHMRVACRFEHPGDAHGCVPRDHSLPPDTVLDR